MVEEQGTYSTGPARGTELRPPRPRPNGPATVEAALVRPVPPPRARPRTLRRTLVGITVLLVLVIGAGGWFLLGRHGKPKPSSTPPAPVRSTVVPISVAGLKKIAGLGIPIYWAGERQGITYELTKTAGNRVFVRYLPAGVPVGSDAPHLTIATYPVNDAFAVTGRAANQAGAVRIDTGSGIVAFYDRDKPTNVFLAYRGSSSQVEVFDPSAAEAQQLVSSGQIGPVSAGSSSASGARAVSAAGLASVAAARPDPVYWVGPEPGVTYELTETSSGRLYLRYLPAGVAVGSADQYLAIGTYPVAHAFAVTRARSKAAGAVPVRIGRGAVAFYERSRPTNVYVAYPGENVQIEVFDPSPARARDIVTSGRLVTVE
jgi:hypothetical protein